MRSLAVNQANLDNQRNAVQEERRLRRGQPTLREDLRSDQTKRHTTTFAYKHSVIGSMEDLNAASLQDVQDFFRDITRPTTRCSTLVGDFKTEERWRR